jgi:cell division protein FtsB
MSIVSNLIKYGLILVFVVVFVVLITQYIVIGNLKSQHNAISDQLSALEQELAEKEEELDSIENNYEQYVEDYAKENLDMSHDGETVFKGE